MIDACPRCKARTEAEAETMCRPGEDDCPMTVCDDWTEAMAELNRLAAWEPSAEEIAALDSSPSARDLP